MNRLIVKAALCSALWVTCVNVNAVDVVREANLNGEAKALWSKIGGWCAISQWHPAITGCKEMVEDGAMRRVLTLADGATIKERLTGWSGMSYSYIIEESPLPIANYAATLTMVNRQDGGAYLNWASSFDAKGVSDDEASNLIGGIYEAGFDAIKK